MLAGCNARSALNAGIQAMAAAIRTTFFSAGRSLPNVTRFVNDIFLGTAHFRISACAMLGADGLTDASIIVTIHEHTAEGSLTQVPPALCARLGLTEREGEVAALLAARLTNIEIAHELGVSEHTARHHTENVLAKLGVKTRRQVADSRTG